MVMEGDLTWGGEHTMQYTDDILQNCTPETYIILLTNVTPMNSVKKNKNKLGMKWNYLNQEFLPKTCRGPVQHEDVGPWFKSY